MSGWTHLICEACWAMYAPERDPVRLKEEMAGMLIVGDEQTCCNCGIPCSRTIFIREDPKKMLCQGVHKEGACGS